MKDNHFNPHDLPNFKKLLEMAQGYNVSLVMRNSCPNGLAQAL
jgi:hypothetical protein